MLADDRGQRSGVVASRWDTAAPVARARATPNSRRGIAQWDTRTSSSERCVLSRPSRRRPSHPYHCTVTTSPLVVTWTTLPRVVLHNSLRSTTSPTLKCSKRLLLGWRMAHSHHPDTGSPAFAIPAAQINARYTWDSTLTASNRGRGAGAARVTRAAVRQSIIRAAGPENPGWQRALDCSSVRDRVFRRSAWSRRSTLGPGCGGYQIPPAVGGMMHVVQVRLLTHMRIYRFASRKDRVPGGSS